MTRSAWARRWLLVALALGAIVRVGWVAYAAKPPSFVSDPSAFLLQGKQIAHGHGYTNPLVDAINEQREAAGLPKFPEQPSSFYPPGYSTFVGLVAWTAWHSPIPDDDGAIVRTVALLQALLGVLSILMVYEIARRAVDERVAVVAAFMFALYPALVTLTATLQLESLFIPLMLAAMLAVMPVASADESSTLRLLAVGALIGAVTLVRPTVALLIIACVVARIVARRPWRETARIALLLIVAMVVVMIPWTVRNAVRLHAFVPSATGIGPALCMARNVDASGHIDSTVLAARCGLADDPNRTPAQDEVETNNYATRQAMKWVLHHPVDELRMWFWRSFYAYRHDTTAIDDVGPKINPRVYEVAETASDSASFLVLGVAAVGAVALAVSRRRAAIFVLASAVCFAVVPIMLFGDSRYRMPAEPMFVIMAATALCAAIDGIVNARASSRA